MNQVEMQVIRPLPNRDSDWSRDWDLYKPFWEGTREGKLFVQECTATGKKIWPPRFLSPYEPGSEIRWVEVGTSGVVYTFNIVHRAFYPYFKERVPYALVAVDVGDGVRFLGNTVDMDPTKVKVGMEMEAVFEKVNDEVTLVHWKPVNGGN
jgi:uncharacterized protein